MLTQPLASISSVIKFVSSYIDDQAWYLNYVSQTTSNFPPKIQQFITESQTEDYSSYYTDICNLNILFLKGISFVPGLPEFIKALNQIPIEQAPNFMNPYLEQLSKFSLDDLDEQSDLDENSELTVDEIDALRSLIRWGLISLKDLTSLMVFGERIFSLVQKAILGDVESFAKVIQIDPSAAKNIPEFRVMIGEACTSEKSDLLDAIIYRKNNFVGRSKHKYHHIFILFYVLDMLQMLDRMSNRQVLELYIDSGLNAYEEILEVKTVAERRKFYQRSKI